MASLPADLPPIRPIAIQEDGNDLQVGTAMIPLKRENWTVHNGWIRDQKTRTVELLGDYEDLREDFGRNYQTRFFLPWRDLSELQQYIQELRKGNVQLNFNFSVYWIIIVEDSPSDQKVQNDRSAPLAQRAPAVVDFVFLNPDAREWFDTFVGPECSDFNASFRETQVQGWAELPAMRLAYKDPEEDADRINRIRGLFATIKERFGQFSIKSALLRLNHPRFPEAPFSPGLVNDVNDDAVRQMQLEHQREYNIEPEKGLVGQIKIMPELSSTYDVTQEEVEQWIANPASLADLQITRYRGSLASAIQEEENEEQLKSLVKEAKRPGAGSGALRTAVQNVWKQGDLDRLARLGNAGASEMLLTVMLQEERKEK